MLDVLSEIYRQRGQAAPDRRGADRSVHTVGYLIEAPDPVTYLCTVSVFDSEPIAGVPATSMDYTDITAVHVLLDPFTGRPVHVLGPAGELPFGEAPFARDTRHVATGHVVPPTSTGTYREDEAAWDRYSTTTFGGVIDVWQQAADVVGEVVPVGSAISTDNLSAYTFEDVPLGDASASRSIIVCVVAQNATGGDTITIGGVTATYVADNSFGSGTDQVLFAWAHAAVPTGTTGDITISLNDLAYSAAVMVWRVEGTVEYQFSDVEWTVVPANCVTIATVNWESSDPASTWTGARQDFSLNIGDGRDARASGAVNETDTGTVTISHSASGASGPTLTVWEIT